MSHDLDMISFSELFALFVRDLYKFMLAAQRGKGRSRNLKGENFSTQQLQEAQEAYDEEATLFVFRLKSLKQGQSRSLLTQAARHHAAQVISAATISQEFGFDIPAYRN